MLELFIGHFRDHKPCVGLALANSGDPAAFRRAERQARRTIREAWLNERVCTRCGDQVPAFEIMIISRATGEIVRNYAPRLL